jgi:hypothetical protein
VQAGWALNGVSKVGVKRDEAIISLGASVGPERDDQGVFG